jgi:hypothetical protein
LLSLAGHVRVARQVKSGKLVRWKWSEIIAALDGGSITVIEIEKDAFEKGIERAKAANSRAA